MRCLIPAHTVSGERSCRIPHLRLTPKDPDQSSIEENPLTKGARQMSTLMDAELVNGLVLAAVLQADLGSHRKITLHRMARPILLAAAVVPLFVETVATRGG